MDKVEHSFPRVTVTWADHYTEYEDVDLDHIKEMVQNPYIGEYTGYLVAQSKRVIAIVSNVWDDESLSTPMYIMKKSIINLEYLSGSKK